MGPYLNELLQILVNGLNENEKLDFIKNLIPNLSSKNEAKLKCMSTENALFYTLELLDELELLSNSDIDILVQTLLKMKKHSLSLKLESHCNLSSKTIEINGVSIRLDFEPYEFQLKLAQKGCHNQNNIICSRTGSGKTLIASIICKYWATVAKRNNKKFLMAFLVPTRYLALQQSKSFENSFNPEELEHNTENMNGAKMNQCFENSKILFLTPQKLINLLNQKLVKITDFNVLIFDEAHHTNDDHPYNVIMSNYFNEKQKDHSKVPLIIGLTASLGTGANDSAISHLLKLSANLDCREISNLCSPEDLENFNKHISSHLDDKIILVEQSPQFKYLSDKIILCLDNIAVKGQVLKCLRNPSNATDLYLIRKKIGEPEFDSALSMEKNNAAAYEDRNGIIALKYIDELNLLYNRVKDFDISYCIKLLEDFYTKSEIQRPIEIEQYAKDQVQKLIDYMKNNRRQLSDNPKLIKLVGILKQCHKDDSRGLILVRTRLHTKALYEYINSLPLSNLNFKPRLVPCVLTGQGKSDDLLMNENEQQNSIESFRNGSCNLMIATDIAQEGLDVPKCQYVIRYEFVSNEIGTIQSRGRARAIRGQCFLITAPNSINERRELKNREKELEMDRALAQMRKLNKSDLEEIYNLYLAKKVESSLKSIPSVLKVNEPKFKFKAHSIKVHCKDCSKELFTGADIKYREPSYFSINRTFIERHVTINNANQKFYCSDMSCNKELGRLVMFKNSKTLYMIEIKGVKWLTPSSKSFESIKKWSKVAELFKIENIL